MSTIKASRYQVPPKMLEEITSFVDGNMGALIAYAYADDPDSKEYKDALAIAKKNKVKVPNKKWRTKSKNFKIDLAGWKYKDVLPKDVLKKTINDFGGVKVKIEFSMSSSGARAHWDGSRREIVIFLNPFNPLKSYRSSIEHELGHFVQSFMKMGGIEKFGQPSKKVRDNVQWKGEMWDGSYELNDIEFYTHVNNAIDYINSGEMTLDKYLNTKFPKTLKKYNKRKWYEFVKQVMSNLNKRVAAPKVENTTPEAVENDYVITYSTGSKKWTNDRPGDGIGDLEHMLDDIAVQRGLDAIANSINNNGKGLKSAVNAMIRDTGTHKGKTVLNAVYKGMKNSNAPDKQVYGWNEARNMVAGIKDVVEKIFDTFSVNRATEIAERLVEYYKTKNKKLDLTPREQNQIYNRVDYGDTLPLTKKRKLDVDWTDHGEYRSDLRDVNPDKVNKVVRERLREKLNPPQRNKIKFKEPGVGTMVVDFNTKKKPADARVVTVWGSQSFNNTSIDKWSEKMDTKDLENRVAVRFASMDDRLVTANEMKPYCEDCAEKIATGELKVTWGELRELLA